MLVFFFLFVVGRDLGNVQVRFFFSFFFFADVDGAAHTYKI